MKFSGLRKVSAFCAFALALASVAQGAVINGQVDYTGGAFSTWSIQFASLNPAVELQQIAITLPATYGFDTQTGGFGYLLAQDFTQTGGLATATSLTPNTTGTRDGSGALTVGFSGFDAASGTFTFGIDVDGTATLTPLLSCAGKTGFALFQCNLQNVAINAANALLSTGASLVDGSEIAGSQIALTFGGTGITPVTLTTSLGQTGLLTASGAFQTVPEPSSYALMGSGLLGLAWAVRRRRK